MIGQECGIFGHDFLIDGAAALRISIDSDVIDGDGFGGGL